MVWRAAWLRGQHGIEGYMVSSAAWHCMAYTAACYYCTSPAQVVETLLYFIKLLSINSSGMQGGTGEHDYLKNCATRRQLTSFFSASIMRTDFYLSQQDILMEYQDMIRNAGIYKLVLRYVTLPYNKKASEVCRLTPPPPQAVLPLAVTRCPSRAALLPMQPRTTLCHAAPVLSSPRMRRAPPGLRSGKSAPTRLVSLLLTGLAVCDVEDVWQSGATRHSAKCNPRENMLLPSPL